jgi:hypothetical protein
MLKPESADANQQTVGNIVNLFSRFSAAQWEEDQNIASSPAAMGFDKPELVVTLVFSVGSAKTITVGKAKEGKSMFWVKVSDKDDVYLVNDYNIQTFDKKVVDLKPAVPGAVAAPAVPPAPKIIKKNIKVPAR